MSRISNAQGGFTLVEMIMVMVITGIIGGMVAVFLQAPIQQYMDVARRADMTDIADTALRRVARDLRMALPNSVRVTGTCNGTSPCYIEFLPTSGGGRYRLEPPESGVPATDVLNFAAADTSFDVIGPMPVIPASGVVVVYNLGIPGSSAYDGSSRTTTGVAAGANNITIPSKLFPFDSCQTDPVTGLRGGCRFQVVSPPVTYVCAPAAGGVGGTLTRYWGYAIQPGQPGNISAAPLKDASSALLASNVSGCRFDYNNNVVAERSGLVTMRLSITEANPSGGDETVTLYSATHVSNVP